MIFRIIKRLYSRLSLSIWSSREIKAIRELKRKINLNDSSASSEEITVVVDGFLGMQFVSIYFVLLLFVLSKKSEKKIKVILLIYNRFDKYLIASRIYPIFFQTEFVAVSTYLRSHEVKLAEKHVADIISKIRCGQDLFDMTYRNIRIGRDIYYSYLRSKLLGTIDIVDDEVLNQVFVAIRNIFVAQKIIFKHKPEFLLITDNCYVHFSPYFHIFLKNDIPVALTVPHAPETAKVCGRVYRSLADTEDVHRRYPFSFDDATWLKILENYGEVEDSLIENYLQLRFSGNDLAFNGDYHKTTRKLQSGSIREQLQLLQNDERKIILIAAHLFWDDPGYDGLYRDYEVWLIDTLKTIALNTQVIWILKAHPSEKHMSTNSYARDIVQNIFGNELPSHIRFLDADTDINTYSLIDFSNAVLTVRGTIGLEAACKGKQVICAGYGPYSNLGFSLEFSSQIQYREFLLNLHQESIELSEDQIRLARISLYGYFIRKAPISQILIRGANIEDYSDVTQGELLADATLNRFAEKILSKTGGDLL